MPVTEFQKQTLRLLAARRSSGRHLGGGLAIHVADSSPRYSMDADFFHEKAAFIRESSSSDLELLTEAGYQSIVEINDESHIRALVRKGNDELRLDWVYDTSVCFFNPVQSEELGTLLHPVDLAVNKARAAGTRRALRDVVDMLWLEEQGYPPEALFWAVPGKNPEFTPAFLVNNARRGFTNYELSEVQQELSSLRLTKEPSLPEISERWFGMLDRTDEMLREMRNILGSRPGVVYVQGSKLLKPADAIIQGVEPRQPRQLQTAIPQTETVALGQSFIGYDRTIRSAGSEFR